MNVAAGENIIITQNYVIIGIMFLTMLVIAYGTFYGVKTYQIEEKKYNRDGD